MEYNKAVDLLTNTVNQLDLIKIKLLDHLNNEEPIIYLCGKSSTGKTTFLNALFNMDKNELFTSTDISTKTEFRFMFGIDNVYFIDGENEKQIPPTVTERKELFKAINKEGNKYILKLNEVALNGRAIVDIPGVFDFTGNRIFSQNMLNEADIVYFFSPCMAKVSSEQYELLNKISDANIPIIVLFTMGDLTEPDEGITRKTLPDLVKNRLDSCFSGINVSHYQIISSNDFYKEKEDHGIDKLQSHIELNDTKYKEIAENGRLKRGLNYYIDLIENIIKDLEKDKFDIVNLIKRENELWYKTEQKKINDKEIEDVRNISKELEWLKNTCSDHVFKNMFSNQNVSEKDQKEKFSNFWKEFWVKLNNESIKISFETPSLPIIKDDVFKQIEINTDKLKEIQERFTKKTEDKKENSKENKKNKEVKKETDSITISDLIELGLNLHNATIIYNKWDFNEQVKDIISNNKESIISKINVVVKKRGEELLNEKENKIKHSLSEDITINKLTDYVQHLDVLKKIRNDI
jgi:hypothetical protein